MTFHHTIGDAVKVIEAFGAVIMIGGAVYAFGVFGLALPDPQTRARSWEPLRRNLGRAILLGLEVLIMADIIRTIVIDQTAESVAVLGVVVLIRVVLSFSLDVEIEGVWPWSRWRKGRLGVDRGRGAPEPSNSGPPPRTAVRSRCVGGIPLGAPSPHAGRTGESEFAPASVVDCPVRRRRRRDPARSISRRDRAGASRPRRWAVSTASSRDFAFSSRSVDFTWFRTVSGESAISSAICVVVRPSPSSRRISCCRGVRVGASSDTAGGGGAGRSLRMTP